MANLNARLKKELTRMKDLSPAAEDEILLISMKVWHPGHVFRISPRTRTIQRKRPSRWITVCEHNREPYRCKDCKKEEEEEPIDYLRRTYPQHCFRLSRSGKLQRKRPSGWVTVCLHNKQPHLCKECGGDSICKKHKIQKAFCCGSAKCNHKIQKAFCLECGGNAKCKHKIQKAFCLECGGNAKCKHKIQKAFCSVCGGTAMCKHKIQKAFCSVCGGTAMCKHKIQKAFCSECGGNAKCKHEIQKAFCSECGGNAICEEHEVQAAFCIDCGGNQVCECGIRIKQLDNYCLHCHPHYEFTPRGCSKISCNFIDQLEIELGVKILHKHYDQAQGEWSGYEHAPMKWRKKGIDGFYEKDDGTKVAVEFLGDVWHGHPSLWKEDKTATNFHKVPYSYLFEDAQMKLQKLRTLGYQVFYIWEHEFKNDGLESYQEFHGRLLATTHE